jgi:hypothetical protein
MPAERVRLAKMQELADIRLADLTSWPWSGHARTLNVLDGLHEGIDGAAIAKITGYDLGVYGPIRRFGALPPFTSAAAACPEGGASSTLREAR